MSIFISSISNVHIDLIWDQFRSFNSTLLKQFKNTREIKAKFFQVFFLPLTEYTKQYTVFSNASKFGKLINTTQNEDFFFAFDKLINLNYRKEYHFTFAEFCVVYVCIVYIDVNVIEPTRKIFSFSHF